MSSGRNVRSSRRSRGSSPARRNDDFPAPDGPRITNSDFTPEARMPAQLVQAAHDLGVAPEEHRRIGFLQRCPPPIRGALRVIRRRPREIAPPRSPTRADHPATAAGPRWPTPPARRRRRSISVVGPSPTNRSQRCHSEVMLVSGTGSSRAHHDRLVQRLGIPELGLAFRGGFPMRRQQADHRLTAGVGLLQRLLPAFPGPDAGVRVQIQVDLLGQPRLLLDQPRLDRRPPDGYPGWNDSKTPATPLTPCNANPGNRHPQDQPVQCSRR